MNRQKMVNQPRIAGLYAIADTKYLNHTRLISAVGEAIAGGARAIQYRDKSQEVSARLAQVKKIVTLCQQHGVLFIVNDDVDLAKQALADGVHLGREDASLIHARAQLGPKALIGISCYNDLTRAQRAQSEGADYVAFGSFFPSVTKPGAVRADTELLRKAKQKLHIPIVAIGGITPENGASLIAAGADALAAVEGVFAQTDVLVAARRYAVLFADKT